MNKKIVAITANTCWYIYNFRKNTILALLGRGYKVIFCSPRDEYVPYLEELGCVFREVEIDRSGKNPVRDFHTIFSFYRIFKKNKVNVVLNFTPKNNIYSTIAAKTAHAKVINNIAGLGAAFGNSGLLNKIVRLLYKYSQAKADFIFFQNVDDEKIFQKLNINLKNSCVLPGSGVDLERFSFTEAPNDQVIRFSLVARMLIDKGVYQFVEAAKILKEKYRSGVEFILVGFIEDGDSRSISSEEMSGWVNNGYVKYLGVSNNIEQIVGGVDCAVLPSFYREGVPKSLLEAAAMGKPIITTDNVGCRETVEDGVTGYLCQPRSVDDLCHKMELIISMSAVQRSNMGRLGRKRVEKLFDEKIVIEKYINAVGMVLN